MSGVRVACGVAVFVVFAMLGAACTSAAHEEASKAEAADTASPDGLEEFYGQDLEWAECHGGFECSSFDVPLDYDTPGGQHLDIAVMRLPASGGDPLGSLVVNPGGPGASGLDYVASAENVVSAEVRERFDVVGFDPRGVGQSSPVRCLDTEGVDEFLGAELEIDGEGRLSAEGLEAAEEENARFVDACEAESGNLLSHIGTADVARDLDVLRAVLGDEELTYLGKSYGTYIGTHYAAQFPDRLRAAVLDGAMDPTLSGAELGAEQAEGFQTALEAFVEDCLGREDCPLAGSPDDDMADAMERLGELRDEAAEEPLGNELGDGREVNAARVTLGVAAALYSEASWPSVRSALAAALDGDGTELLQLGDRLYGRDAGGSYVNTVAALTAVNCLDRGAPEDMEEFQDIAESAYEDSEMFGPWLTWGTLVCAEWPAQSDPEPVDFSADGAPDILVVGTTRDSATPYHWAERLAAELDSGVLLTLDGDGHTAYRTAGSQCVDEAVDTYLLGAEAPEDGARCGS